jgi:hypothetical protein
VKKRENIQVEFRKYGIFCSAKTGAGWPEGCWGMCVGSSVDLQLIVTANNLRCAEEVDATFFPQRETRMSEIRGFSSRSRTQSCQLRG